MSATTARFAHQDDIWFLKLTGDVRHTLAPSLDRLLDRALGEPVPTRFVIDLIDADTVDSTCLGVIARIGNHSARTGGPKPVIVCPNEDVHQVLLAVCFDRMFDLVAQFTSNTDRLAPLPAADGSDQIRQLMLDAHHRLCDIDKQNHRAFKDVIHALENDAND